MKNLFKVSIGLTILFICSCTPIYNYQVFNNTSTDEKKIIAFENDEIRIHYDFWADYGQLQIHVRNKTQAPLFIDLNQCALVLNEIAEPVFKDVEWTTTISDSRGRALSYFNRYGFFETPNIIRGASWAYTERPNPMIYLPPNATIIRTLLPGQLAFRYIGAEAKLSRREKSKSLSFTKERSPYRFLFSLSYSQHKDFQQLKTMEDEFWVESIMIMREKVFLGELVEQRNNVDIYSMPYQKKSAFYVKYQVGGLKE
ncbi:MAG: hypothetical protein R3D58_14800 [Saprospiraceae bacterium]